MIQRIQTLFLLLVAIGMGGFLTLPVWQKVKSDGAQAIEMNAYSITTQLNAVQAEVKPMYYLAVLAFMVAAVAVFSIFKYRNRLLQSGLCAINSILLTVVMGIVVYQTLFAAGRLFEPEAKGDFLYGFFGIIVAMISNSLANRFIRKDEKMVKDSGRFRK